MRTRILYAIVFLALAAFLISGCAGFQEGPAPAGSKKTEEGTDVSLNQVVFLDKELPHKILVQSTGARRSPNDTVEVWALLQNRTDYPLQIEGRVAFFDRYQAPVEGPSAWHRVMLPPNSTITYQEFSTKVMEVGYYYIELREGR